MTKIKVSGGMDKNWIQKVRNSSAANYAVEREYRKVKDLAERKSKAAVKSGFKHHYGSKKLSGSWGDTWLIWGMSPVARKRTEILKRSAAKNLQERK